MRLSSKTDAGKSICYDQADQLHAAAMQLFVGGSLLPTVTFAAVRRWFLQVHSTSCCPANTSNKHASKQPPGRSVAPEAVLCPDHKGCVTGEM